MSGDFTFGTQVIEKNELVSSDLAGAPRAYNCLWQSVRMTTQKTC